MDGGHRDAQAVFAVRVTLLFLLLAAASGLLVAGTAKLLDPAYDAGAFATLAACPIGAGLTALLVALGRRRRAARCRS